MTTFVGTAHYYGFTADFGDQVPQQLPGWTAYFNGLWYSLAILSILGAHEMGHYIACRYYRVDASLPYFLPAPFLLTGTLGAFIRIRQPIPNKRELFDIGIAGPIAGFLVESQCSSLASASRAWSASRPGSKGSNSASRCCSRG